MTLGDELLYGKRKERRKESSSDWRRDGDSWFHKIEDIHIVILKHTAYGKSWFEVWKVKDGKQERISEHLDSKDAGISFIKKYVNKGGF